MHFCALAGLTPLIIQSLWDKIVNRSVRSQNSLLSHFHPSFLSQYQTDNVLEEDNLNNLLLSVTTWRQKKPGNCII